MDQLEIGFYSAVAVYGVIAIWTVLVRLRWLPVALVRFVWRLLNRLGRIPVLGRAVTPCRRYPLGAGMVLAVVAGLAVPYLVLSVLWGVYLLSFAAAIFLGWVASGRSQDDDASDEPDPYGLYQEKHGHGLVHGSSPYADGDRPVG